MKLILFPHSYIHRPLLERILNLFDTLSIFLPWEMDLPDYIKSEKSIETVYPSADLTPPDKIRSLLSEYYQWMKQDIDKSHLEIIRAKQVTDSLKNESASWEIRAILGSMISESKPKDHDNLLPWHMILHMAREVEKQGFEAEGLLKTLKRKSPLLDGSIETIDSLHGFLDDLPGIRSEAGFTEENIKRIIDAWFGLFNNNLKQKDLLLTCNRQIMNFLCERYDKFESGIRTQNLQTIHLNIPLTDGIKAVKAESSTTLQIKDIILNASEDPEQCISDLSKLSEELKKSSADLPSDNSLTITLTYFRPFQDKNPINADNILKLFSGRMLLLAEGYYE